MTFSPYEIRRLNASHLPEIMSIIRGNPEINWSSSMVRDSLMASNIGILGLVQSSKLKAFAIYSKVISEAELLAIAVERSEIGKGYGHLLLHSLIGLLQEKGIGMIFSEVRVSNSRAIKFYESHGFEQIGVRKNYYKALSGEGREDALLMRLKVQ